MSEVLNLTKAAADVLAERRRQVEAEGWTPEHDDEHEWGQMAEAAACYITGSVQWSTRDTWQRWPWEMAWWKPKDRRSDLVRAAALLLAEIERIDRAAELLKDEINERQFNADATAVLEIERLTGQVADLQAEIAADERNLNQLTDDLAKARALNAEMLEALKLMCHCFLDTEGSHGQLEHEATEAANAAIAKAEASNGQ